MIKSRNTKYSANMDKSNPHAYYPRPSFVRDSFFSLNGTWEFCTSRKYSTPSYEEEITVPFPPESLLSGIERSMKDTPYLYYKRNFKLPSGFIRGRVLLHFGAVDQECTVYLNGKAAGGHTGGYLPFTLDVTELISNEENSIEVHVTDRLDKKIPYGKQRYKRGGIWYTPISGIWQTVWIESVPSTYIESIKITPTCSGVTLKTVGGEAKKKVTLTDSGEVFEFCGDECFIVPKEIKLWTPDTPYLYNFTLECGEDRIESYFALREVGTASYNGIPRLTLNGKPYIFNGLLDQGYYSDGIYTPATEEAYLDDIRLAKRLGFNMLRKHIKIEPDIFYYLCDKEGIAVFQDMVNNGNYSFIRDTALPTIGMQRLPDKLLHSNKKSRENFLSDMKATAELLYNHPSIVYYTIFNEAWGQFASDDVYKIFTDIDHTRIVDSTSGWFRRKLSDVDSRHIYFRELKVKDKSDKPLVISEFGGYSFCPEEHRTSDRSFGYRIFKTQEEYENAFIELYENEVIPMMDLGACAFVYTELSDVEDETNGIVTYDREYVKIKDDKRCKDVMAKIALE